MAILQPEVPHYRTEFFQKLANNMKKLDIFIFNPLSSTKQSGFKDIYCKQENKRNTHI